MKQCLYLVLLVFVLSINTVAIADEMGKMDRISIQIEDISKKISKGQFDGDVLAFWNKQIIQLKSEASLCVSNSEIELQKLKAVVDGLGKKVDNEDIEVTKKRKTYKQQEEELNKKLAKCNLYIASAEEAGGFIDEAEKSFFKQKYLPKRKNIVELIEVYFSNPVAVFEEASEFIFNYSGLQALNSIAIISSVAAILLAFAFGVWLRKKLLQFESKSVWHEEYSENLMRAALTTLSCYLPFVFGSAAAAVSAVIVAPELDSVLFVKQFFIGILVFFIAIALIRFIFSPYPPAKLFISLTPAIAQSLARRLKVLAILGLIGYLAFYTAFSDSLNEANLMLLRSIFSLFYVINVVWTLQVIIKSPRLPTLRYVSWLVIFLVIGSLIVEWLGYRNLAFASRRVIFFTFITFIVFVAISKLFRDLFNAIDAGKYGWCRQIHKTLGVEENHKVPGLIWIRLLTVIVLWGMFAILFINTFDYSGGVIEQVRGYLVNGFDIGEARIIPGRILWALLVFGMIIVLSGWVRSQLEQNWLKLTSMGHGARDAMVTIIGYIMFIIAILAGMAIAGFNFGNIAIIAGALSVGIGFGLQNIVNNFVSGLILLFERPIRKGDWIIVGGTEGYVKDITIRSTRIQTFDRSDVIVPNSELISNQVTNWVLSSTSGRAVIPVGVAYGTNTEKVREILFAIADGNENVMKEGSDSGPKVLFRGFGDSSLDFELRVFLYNIESRLSIVSEINFAIDKAFREEGIEIPFPQRDLHVKSMPENPSAN